MAKVPGTDIDKPAVDLTDTNNPFQKVRRAQRALRRVGVPENVVQTFCAAAASGNNQMFGNLDTTLAQYTEVVE